MGGGYAISSSCTETAAVIFSDRISLNLEGKAIASVRSSVHPFVSTFDYSLLNR